MRVLLASQWHEAARLAATLGKPGPLSAAEREQQREAYVAAVDGMATVLRETVARVDADLEDMHALRMVQIETAQHATRRIDALESAVDGMATQVRILTDQMRARSQMEHALHKAHKEMAARIEHCERDATLQPFLARLRWLLTGR